MTRRLIEEYDTLRLADWRADTGLRPGITCSTIWPSGLRADVTIVGDSRTGVASGADVRLAMPSGMRQFRVCFAFTTLTYGQRAWLECTACSSRVGTLLVYHGEVGCRCCLPVCYATQRERALERLVRRVGHASAKAGGDGVGLHHTPARPRGRWAQTHRLAVAAWEETLFHLMEALTR